ncbi:MAG: hypothetical protein HY709_02535 [Candidatus Latescibacteria bacterium]|nr:hypothetical protein [Candidatus Latescibacterota bacterium]
MTWNEAKDKSIAKWTEIEQLIDLHDPRILSEEVAEACAFCEKAHEAVTQSFNDGSKRHHHQCLFCEAYVHYGGCQHPIDDLLLAIGQEEWEKVQAQVRWVISQLETMEFQAV